MKNLFDIFQVKVNVSYVMILVTISSYNYPYMKTFVGCLRMILRIMRIILLYRHNSITDNENAEM